MCGEQMECRPPRPICAEGGGGTQLLGRRPLPGPEGLAHPSWQGCQPVIHLIPKVPMERERGDHRERRGKGERREVI